jgi:predicted ribosome quality control (RQC) complex YloA/Tae2 family protein
MRIDAATLGALAHELAPSLTGARINPVIAPTPLSVALQCYVAGQNHWLIVSAHSKWGRVCLAPARPARLVVEPSPFVMLLRKHLESGRIFEIRWIPWERIVEIDVRQHDGTATLIAEIMGNLANIILVDEQRVILGALRPVGMALNHYRAILPGRPYVPPPPQTRVLDGVTLPKIAPEAVTGDDLAIAARAMGDAVPATRVLMSHVAGMSPDLAREALCRAGAQPDATIAPDDRAGWSAVAATIGDLARILAHEALQPTAFLDAQEHIADGSIFDSACPDDRPRRRMASVNDLVGDLSAGQEWSDTLASARADVRRTLKTLADRLTKKLALLRAEMDDLARADTLRVEGELLLAFASEIPMGAASFTVPDLGDGAAPRIIALDPRLTAIENANQRFARYHKLRRASAQIPEQIARAEADLAQVTQWQSDLDLAESQAEIAQVRAEIKAARPAREEAIAPRKPVKKGKADASKGKGSHAGGTPMTMKSADGFTMYVGKNSQQNEYVTFRVASGNDLWFHARGVPGAHVVIKSGGRPVSQETIAQAAQLAAWFSQSRGAGSVPVDYTEQRYVRHMQHGGPGMVVYTHERTLHAVPRDARVAQG